MLAVGGVEIDPAARRACRDGAPMALRPREFDLLLLLARNAGRVVARDRILTELWSDSWGGPRRRSTCTSRRCAGRSATPIRSRRCAASAIASMPREAADRQGHRRQRAGDAGAVRAAARLGGRARLPPRSAVAARDRRAGRRARADGGAAAADSGRGAGPDRRHPGRLLRRRGPVPGRPRPGRRRRGGGGGAARLRAAHAAHRGGAGGAGRARRRRRPGRGAGVAR